MRAYCRFFAEVHSVLLKKAAFADQVRSSAWKGHTGKRIKNVVNIGSGGFYLGPEMAYATLCSFADGKLNGADREE
jgi:glucose-6-phosphate isomerase